MRILVVDDEPDLCEILCFNLESEGFDTAYAYSAESALAMISDGERFNLILLDVMMERMSGFEMARQLRAQGYNTPVIFLTALNSETEQLQGFASGCDDYITKPFSFPTVLARVRAVLKRSESPSNQPPQENVYASGLELDMQHKIVTLNGNRLSLTKKEFLILSLLMQHRGTHLSREAIIEKVWGDDIFVGDRSVDVHIARLRKKLGPAGSCISNHSGFGYSFDEQ